MFYFLAGSVQILIAFGIQHRYEAILHLLTACGSLNNLNVEKCSALRGHAVTLFPDLNCYDKWKAKAEELAHITSVNVPYLLEVKATETENARCLDLADYLLRFDLRDFTVAIP